MSKNDIFGILGKKLGFAVVAVILIISPILLYQYAKMQNTQSDSSLSSLQLNYKKAVQDAKYTNSSKIRGNLTSITPENPLLEWDTKGRVLMVTWTAYTGYDNYTGKEMNLSREVWVSADKEMRNFCKTLPANEPSRTLRIEQKMGLPPQGGKTRFVEIYVLPSDLFRPCPDPEITDSECGLDFPANVSLEYEEWFEALNASSYLENGYPWTRLGYTYDWGNSSDNFGLSEFVIRKDASVLIQNVSLIGQYCG